MEQISKGHVGWLGGTELYIREDTGSLYRAPASRDLDDDGYRMGGRWECDAWQVNEMLRNFSEWMTEEPTR